MHKPLMTVADPPMLTLVIDRDATDRIVDRYLEDDTPIIWPVLSEIQLDQVRARLKDEACDPWNINHRPIRVSKSLIALVESHR